MNPSIDWMWPACGSLLLLLAATVTCWLTRLFDSHDQLGINGLLIAAAYATIWAIPSLVLWNIWAMWFRCPCG